MVGMAKVGLSIGPCLMQMSGASNAEDGKGGSVISLEIFRPNAVY